MFLEVIFLIFQKHLDLLGKDNEIFIDSLWEFVYTMFVTMYGLHAISIRGFKNNCICIMYIEFGWCVNDWINHGYVEQIIP